MTMEDLVKLVTEKEELLKTKQEEIEKMKDKVLRTYADMENIMDRSRREAENSKKFAIQVRYLKGIVLPRLQSKGAQIIGLVPRL